MVAMTTVASTIGTVIYSKSDFFILYALNPPQIISTPQLWSFQTATVSDLFAQCLFTPQIFPACKFSNLSKYSTFCLWFPSGKNLTVTTSEIPVIKNFKTSHKRFSPSPSFLQSNAEAFSHAPQNRFDWRSLRPLVTRWLPPGTRVDFRGNTVMNSSHKIYGLVTQTVKHDSLIPRVHHRLPLKERCWALFYAAWEIKKHKTIFTTMGTW